MSKETDLLESVLSKTTTLVAGVRPDQASSPTPCPGYDVQTLVNHIVGWLRTFAATATDSPSDEDPAAFRVGDDPAGQCAEAAERAVAGFRSGPDDRPVQMSSTLPASMVVGMMLMEYVGHGWDLATATGQPVPYSDDEAEAALAAGHATLKPEYRGPDKTFGFELEPPADATAVERLVAFLGRNPRPS
jgi:uncharacterized protein (TIGR03086 family)